MLIIYIFTYTFIQQIRKKRTEEGSKIQNTKLFYTGATGVSQKLIR